MFAFSVSNCWLRIQGQLDKEHSCCPSNCMEKGYWMTCSWRESTHDTGQWPVFHLQNIIHFKWLFFVGFNRCCWVVFPHSLCSPLFPSSQPIIYIVVLWVVTPCILIAHIVFQRKMLPPSLTQNIPLKYWYPPTRLQGAIKQKIVFIHY